jgi:DNA-binding transcriptional MerR regulator
MKIGDLARFSGLTTHTIRYYEQIGLLPRAARGRSRQREYDASILPWIEFLGRLKVTGMPVADMVRYARLRARGVTTTAERKTLLMQHRQRVLARVAALNDCLSALDAKIANYDDQTTMETTHDVQPDIRRKQVRARLARAH